LKTEPEITATMRHNGSPMLREEDMANESLTAVPDLSSSKKKKKSRKTRAREWAKPRLQKKDKL
jgi:hypothetical protein